MAPGAARKGQTRHPEDFDSSPDEKFAAVTLRDRILIYDFAGEKMLQYLDGGQGQVWFAENLFIWHDFYGSGRKLQAWDLQTRTYKETEFPVRTEIAAFSPDSQFLVVRAPKDDKGEVGLVLCDFPNRTQATSLGAVKSPQASFDGRFVRVSSAEDETPTVALWDCQTRRHIATVQGEVMMSPDEKTLVAWEPDGMAVHDIASGQPLWHASGSPWDFTPNGKFLEVFTEFSVAYYNIESGERRFAISLSPPMNFNPYDVSVISPNGRYKSFVDHLNPQEPGWFATWLGKWLPEAWLPEALSPSVTYTSPVTIVDRDEGSILFHSDYYTTFGHPELVSSDGTLLITAEKGILRCWRLPIGRPWLLVVGIPAAVGVLAVAGSVYLSRRRASSSAV